MLKNIARLESVVENRVGHFLLDNDTPIHIAKEMLFQFIAFLGKIEDAAKAQQEKDNASESKCTEETKEETKIE